MNTALTAFVQLLLLAIAVDTVCWSYAVLRGRVRPLRAVLLFTLSGVALAFVTRFDLIGPAFPAAISVPSLVSYLVSGIIVGRVADFWVTVYTYLVVYRDEVAGSVDAAPVELPVMRMSSRDDGGGSSPGTNLSGGIGIHTS